MGNTAAPGNGNQLEMDLDMLGRITAVSPQVERATDYKPEELLGTPFVALVHYKDLDLVKRMWANALLGEVRVRTIRLAGKYGDVRKVLACSRPRVENGAPIGLVEVMTDPTSPEAS